jgi:polysaccharide pyruvyl transferase WcaK-like protein
VRLVFNHIDAIIVRDESSRRQLLQAGVRRPIHVSADSALALTPAPRERALAILRQEGIPCPGEKLVAFAVFGQAFRTRRGFRTHRALYQQDVWQPGAREQAQHYIQTLAQTADYVVQQLGARVVFFFQERFLDGRSEDRAMTEQVLARMQQAQGAFMLQGEYRADEMLALYGLAEMTISSRFHGVIFSLAMNTPVVGISYEEKIASLLQQLGSSAHVDIERISFEDLKSRVEEVWTNRELYRQMLPPKIEKLQREVLSSLDFARTLLGRSLCME